LECGGKPLEPSSPRLATTKGVKRALFLRRAAFDVSGCSGPSRNSPFSPSRAQNPLAASQGYLRRGPAQTRKCRVLASSDVSLGMLQKRNGTDMPTFERIHAQDTTSTMLILRRGRPPPRQTTKNPGAFARGRDFGQIDVVRTSERRAAAVKPSRVVVERAVGPVSQPTG